MSMNDFFVALLITAPEAPAAEAKLRPCSFGTFGSVQLAYKPYGSPVFGSDGLMCATVKPESEDVGPSAQPKIRRGERPKRKRSR